MYWLIKICEYVHWLNRFNILFSILSAEQKCAKGNCSVLYPDSRRLHPAVSSRYILLNLGTHTRIFCHNEEVWHVQINHELQLHMFIKLASMIFHSVLVSSPSLFWLSKPTLLNIWIFYLLTDKCLNVE